MVPAAADHLVSGIQPSGTTADVAIAPAVTVKVFDQFGNFASNDNSDKVTLAVASTPGGFASDSTTTVTVSGGAPNVQQSDFGHGGQLHPGRDKPLLAASPAPSPSASPWSRRRRTIWPSALVPRAERVTTAGVAISPAVTV